MEGLLLHRLARERLDDAHAGDVLGERRRDEAEALAHAAVGPVGAAAEPGRDERHRDQHGQRRQREPPVEQEEDDGGADEEQGVLDQARDAVRDELVERLDVVRDPADHDAGAVALVEAEREPLQVCEEPVAKVGEDPFADPAGQIGVRCRECEREQGGDEEERDDPRQPAQVLRLDPLVDRELRQVRRRERDERVGEERSERERRAAAVRQREPDEEAQPPARPLPRPVAHLATAQLGEMRPGLPDLHAVSFSSPCRRPCSWISR